MDASGRYSDCRYIWLREMHDAADMLEHALITSTAMYSMRSVNRECLLAQGTGIVRTPDVRRLLRGTAAWIIVVNCIVSRCRHVRSGAMSACGQCFLHSGQSSFKPQYSIRISTSFASGIKLTFVTSQSSRPRRTQKMFEAPLIGTQSFSRMHSKTIAIRVLASSIRISRFAVGSTR